MNNQFQLLKLSRFLPLFITQFLGAFNDNFYKNALLIMVSYNLITSPHSSLIIVNLASGLFILPFFLFSALAGKLSDKYNKAKLIVALKYWELFIMLFAIVGFYFNNLYLLLLVLFGLGTQSAFFGPLKYSILPQHLNQQELVGGNALIESGTFVAILLGTLGAGFLLSYQFNFPVYIILSLLLIFFAFIGILSAYKIPSAPSFNPNLAINLDIFSQSWEIIKLARQTRSIWLSILGISWFWFIGASLLAQFPILVKSVLNAPPGVVSLFLLVFSLGIAIGSILCEKMSGHKIEIGLVPFGSIGMTIFALDLYFSLTALAPLMNQENFRSIVAPHFSSTTQFILDARTHRILLDLFLLSVFGGFFIVPLYALVQSRSEPSVRSQIIGANNIINALFMVFSAIIAVIASLAGYTTLQFILFIALCNLIVAVYIYSLVPEFLMRFLVWIITHSIYHVKKNNLSYLPLEGPAIVVCNHVSFFDAFIIASCAPRPPKFVMYYKIYNLPLLKWAFKAAGAIPIAGRQENQAIFDQAFVEMQKALQDNHLLVIFPEGAITQDGQMQAFKPGILKILATNPVPIIPASISGMYGSMFSRAEKNLFKRLIPKSFFGRKIYFNLAPALSPDQLTTPADLLELEKTVLNLRGNIL